MGTIEETLRVLVAEDDDIDAFLLERAFTKVGMKVPIKFVRDGQEAVDYLAAESIFPDSSAHPLPILLLIDLKMPRLDGFDVLKWLRHHPNLRRLCVVVFSSSNEPQDINLAYDLGANSYAVKPTDPGGLETFVRALGEYWFKRHCYPHSLADTASASDSINDREAHERPSGALFACVQRVGTARGRGPCAVQAWTCWIVPPLTRRGRRSVPSLPTFSCFAAGEESVRRCKGNHRNDRDRSVKALDQFRLWP